MKLYAILATGTRVDITERINTGLTKLVKFGKKSTNEETAKDEARQLRSYYEAVFKEKDGEMVQIGWGIPK